jgi:geranylgeranyl pyrophosphate synthase
MGEKPQFIEDLRQVAPIMDARLRDWALPSDAKAVANLDEAVRYALGLDIEEPAQRGKRVRPALAVLTCEALGGAHEQVLPFAVAVELMHNCFLVHDDIEDGDTMRHGRPAVWSRYGLAHGVNVGDYLLARAFAVALRSLESGVAPPTVLALLDLLAQTFDHTIRGQALDINARTQAAVSIEDYMATVTEKTGHYLAAPIVGGAIVAGADPALLAAIRAYGAAVGPMYQIVDDLIDLTESKGRGERGADIREGKKSFLAASALTRLDPEKRDELLAILERPREATSADDVNRAIELFEECGAVTEARHLIAALERRAAAAAARLPERLRELLSGVTAYLVNRTR